MPLRSRSTHVNRETSYTPIDAANHNLKSITAETHEKVGNVDESMTSGRTQLAVLKGKKDGRLVVVKVCDVLAFPPIPFSFDRPTDTQQTHPSLSSRRASIQSAILTQLHTHTITSTPIAQLLDHDITELSPNIIRLRELTTYYPGGDLHAFKLRHMQSAMLIGEKTLWHFARQLCAALAFLHNGPAAVSSNENAEAWKPILHNDMKPENVLLTPSQRGPKYAPDIKLTDFELASFLPSHSRTATSVTMPSSSSRSTPSNSPDSKESEREGSDAETPGGTEAYASPEYPHTSTKSDVWGLGATLYFAAVGKAPRTEQSPPHDTSHSRPSWPESTPLNERSPLTADPRALERKYAGLDYTSGQYSRRLAQFVGRAMDVDVQSRPEAAELLAGIKGKSGKAPKVAYLKRKMTVVDCDAVGFAGAGADAGLSVEKDAVCQGQPISPVDSGTTSIPRDSHPATPDTSNDVSSTDNKAPILRHVGKPAINATDDWTADWLDEQQARAQQSRTRRALRRVGYTLTPAAFRHRWEV